MSEADIKIGENGVFVPMDIADSITVENLKMVLANVKSELGRHQAGEWMHQDDVKLNHELIPALEKIIWYFGG